MFRLDVPSVTTPSIGTFSPGFTTIVSPTATVSGATLFWVDAGVDTGKIIAQVQVPVKPGDTHESLTERIKAAETPQLVAELGKLVRS